MNFQEYDEIFNKENYPIFIRKGGKTVIADEGMCICLSGKKYKECCKNEVEEALISENSDEEIEKLKKDYYSKESKLLSYKVEKKSIEKKNISYCAAEKIFGECNHENNVMSHTMSRGNVLKNLAGNSGRSVMAFNDHIVLEPNLFKNLDLLYKDKLLEEASLTVSFCKKHDAELFMDIETDGNTIYKKTDIQNLEYALKAVTFEVYYNLEKIKYNSELIKRSKRVLSSCKGEESSLLEDYAINIEELFKLYSYMQKILRELKELKENNRASTLKTIVLDIPANRVNISCSEVIEENQYYFINVINAPKPCMIFSYYPDGKKENWIEAKQEEFRKCKDKINFFYKIILEFIITNAQNIYINKEAYNKLDDEEKRNLYIMHRFGTAFISDEYLEKYYSKILSFLFAYK